jgi:hypothetical protein
VYVCMDVCMYVWMDGGMCMCVYERINTHTHT